MHQVALQEMEHYQKQQTNMNILKGEVEIQGKGFRFSNNAKLKFCEMRGIDFPEMSKEYEKDPLKGLRDMIFCGHQEYCRKYKKDAQLETVEDVMDFIEDDISEEESDLILKAILKSDKLATEEVETKGEKKP